VICLQQYYLEDVKKALRDNYNDSISIYDLNHYIRLTNGSAGMYIDIRTDGSEFHLEGRRYGLKINMRCNRTIDDLLETLSKTI